MPLPPLPSIYLRSAQQPTALAPPVLPPLQRLDVRSNATAEKSSADSRKEPDPVPRSTVASTTGVAEPPKPRKPSYLIQKEERDVLLDEARALEDQLERLRIRAGLPASDEKEAVAAVQSSNFDLEEQIHASRLYLAKLQSLVMRELHEPPVNPMATYIHLPRDMEERRAILRSLRDRKLRCAEDVAVSRLHHLDHTQTFLSEERFITADGIYHCHRLEINPFRNFRSAKQLYDALVMFLYNWEISVSELLDQLAIREDSDEIDPTIWNQRIVTVADDVGCPEELNTVVFARFRDAGSGACDSPVGVIANDTVDEDDLYPYRPEERTCKHFQSVHLIYEIPQGMWEPPLIVLKSCAFTKQLPPQFALDPGVEEKLRENVSRWPVTMLKFLHSYAAASTTVAAP